MYVCNSFKVAAQGVPNVAITLALVSAGHAAAGCNKVTVGVGERCVPSELRSSSLKDALIGLSVSAGRTTTGCSCWGGGRPARGHHLASLCSELSFGWKAALAAASTRHTITM